MDLTDLEAVRAGDPSGMLDAVLASPKHCREGYEGGLRARDLPEAEGVSSIVFCGMGGSAVSGDVVRAVYSDRLNVPVEVIRSPILPVHCGPHTLVVASSYSGNTSETLAAFEEAARRGCRVIAVTSGGEVASRAAQLGVPTVPVPGGFQPRAALGFLAFGALGALEVCGALPHISAEVDETVSLLGDLAAGLGPAGADASARSIASKIDERVPVVWGSDGIASVAAMRWKTQMNENAKVPSFWSAMSELDHNEVVGWADGSASRFAVIGLRDEGETHEISARFPLSFDVARSAGAETVEVRSSGTSRLARLFSLVLTGDLVSVYLGLLRGVDPTPVAVIDRLKASLAGD
jgi:glucose/mannose-6-phosphate isomerase